jgi:Right handed beta helix region
VSVPICDDSATPTVHSAVPTIGRCDSGGGHQIDLQTAAVRGEHRPTDLVGPAVHTMHDAVDRVTDLDVRNASCRERDRIAAANPEAVVSQVDRRRSTEGAFMASTFAIRSTAIAGFALSITAVALGSLVLAAPAGASNRVLVVHEGESIQAAIDAAHPGARIVVQEGTYAEQLVITTDGITLVGEDAVLVPPTSALPPNPCTGLAGDVFDHEGLATEAGICVIGRDVVLAPFEREHRKVTHVGQRVRDVTVKGFEVRGFSGPNIALVATTNARLVDNRLIDGGVYGALSDGSKHTQIAHNVVDVDDLPFGGIGICADDVAPAVVAGNEVSGYIVGLCVQTQDADFRGNDVHDNCVGVYVDPGIGAIVRGNRISTNNGPCESAFGGDTGIGIFLDGTVGTRVRDNRIVGHAPNHGYAALVLTDSTVEGGPPASGNVVQHNLFKDNTLDILVTSTGAGNVVAGNRCTLSDPAEICA